MGGVNRKISAASARSHTRRANQSTSFQLPSGIVKKALALFFFGFVAYAYQAIQPPPPKICGSHEGPAITAPRIKLSDGRHLAYKESGVAKEKAEHTIVFVHGFSCCRHDTLATFLSREVVEELGVYMVSFDRPGYGESDPNPKRTVKSMALDIEELADRLELGDKFYVLGFSMGGQVLWSALKYIPHRIASAALIAPVVNHWWGGFPANISNEAYNGQFLSDRWALRVAHYTPWLAYWWNSQKWFPSSNVMARSPHVFSAQDIEILASPTRKALKKAYANQVTQQGEFESVYRDVIVGFGEWEFSPLELENPFPSNEGSVHLWQGDDDLIVPVTMQRHIAQRLPWIKYHELPGAGHMFPEIEGMCDTIIRDLLIRKN